MSALVVHRYKIKTAVQLGYFERNRNETNNKNFCNKVRGRGLINRHLTQYVMNKFIRQNLLLLHLLKHSYLGCFRGDLECNFLRHYEMIQVYEGCFLFDRPDRLRFTVML